MDGATSLTHWRPAIDKFLKEIKTRRMIKKKKAQRLEANSRQQPRRLLPPGGHPIELWGSSYSLGDWCHKSRQTTRRWGFFFSPQPPAASSEEESSRSMPPAKLQRNRPTGSPCVRHGTARGTQFSRPDQNGRGLFRFANSRWILLVR